jgi:hypothetical protein
MAVAGIAADGRVPRSCNDGGHPHATRASSARVPGLGRAVPP